MCDCSLKVKIRLPPRCKDVWWSGGKALRILILEIIWRWCQAVKKILFWSISVEYIHTLNEVQIKFYPLSQKRLSWQKLCIWNIYVTCHPSCLKYLSFWWIFNGIHRNKNIGHNAIHNFCLKYISLWWYSTKCTELISNTMHCDSCSANNFCNHRHLTAINKRRAFDVYKIAKRNTFGKCVYSTPTSPLLFLINF